MLLCYTGKAADKATTENEKDLEHVQISLDIIRADLLTILNQQKNLTTELNNNFGNLKTYVEESISELEGFVMNETKRADETIMTNVNSLKNNTQKNFDNLAKRMLENDQALKNGSVNETKKIIDWAHGRFKRHEEMMRTHISICAYTFAHFGRGVVNYEQVADSGFLGNPRYRIDDETCENNQNQCLENVLNREKGTFTVPEDMGGVYEFTFAVIMDTYTLETDSSTYIFRKNGDRLIGTDIFGEVGFDKTLDKIQASRTIFLHLNAGDFVDVEQTDPTDVSDYRVTFCGSLLHQNRDPGKNFANPSHPANFPHVVERTLKKYDYATVSDEKAVTYKSFKSEKKKGQEEIKVKPEAKLPKLKVEDKAKWDSYKTSVTRTKND